MSYARWGPFSDVYVFSSVEGGIVCVRCLLAGFLDDFTAPGPAEMLAHLEEHSKAGQMVPASAVELLREELARVPVT